MKRPRVLLLGTLVATIAGAALTLAQGAQEPPKPAEEFLSRFVGRWAAEGQNQEGKNVNREQRCEWVLDRRFIHIRSRSTKGDDFQSEGYLWFNPETHRYELYEFNNAQYPVTTWSGLLVNDRLVLDGKVGGQPIRTTFIWVDENRMQVIQSDDKGQPFKSYAGGTYRKLR